MVQFDAKVISNRSVSKDTYEMEFSWESQDSIPLPGSFFTVRVSAGAVPLLRRPFAFSGFDPVKSTASMVYLKRGESTEILTGRRAGDSMDVIGPLGNVFPEHVGESRPTLVAGGIGLGPMLFLFRKMRAEKLNPLIVFGVRSADMVPDFAANEPGDFHVCTDDGTVGFKGNSVEKLKALESEGCSIGTVYCCGPTPMLLGCHNFARERSLECFVSMEQVMACGVGACMGCVVKVKGDLGYARVCKEGPIFKSTDILWT